MSAPRETVDRQLAAYNHRDLEEFVACYTSDARVVQPDGSLLASGHDEIRARYGELFDLSPNLQAEIRNRIEVGSVVFRLGSYEGSTLGSCATSLKSASATCSEEHASRLAQSKQTIPTSPPPGCK
jgi:hypothetical protein